MPSLASRVLGISVVVLTGLAAGCGADGPAEDAEPDAGLAACEAPFTNILLNPAFDLGPASWTQSSGGGFPIIADSSDLPPSMAPYSGTHAAWLGGYNSANDVLYQTIAVPAGTRALRLSGWRCFASQEPGGINDFADVKLLDATGAPLETLIMFSNEGAGANCNWTPLSASATGSYAGQTLRMQLSAQTNTAMTSNFFFDSLALEAQICP